MPLRVNVMAASVIPQLPNRLEFAGPVRSPGGATYCRRPESAKCVLGMSSDTLDPEFLYKTGERSPDKICELALGAFSIPV